MKIMGKTGLLIALLLAITTFNSQAMEQTWQPPQWAIVIGGILLGTIAVKMLWQPQEPFLLEDLAPEMQDAIMQLLTINTTAESLEIAAKTINSLAQVNKELNEYINDPEFCLKLIKHLAKKFNCSDQKVAETLQTQAAKQRLEMQKELIHLLSGTNPEAKFKELCQHNVDFNFTYYSKGSNYPHAFYTPIILTIQNHNYPLANNIIRCAFHQGINIANQYNPQGDTALILCIKDSMRLNGHRYAYQREEDFLNAMIPIYFDCRRTIIYLLAAGADPELPNADRLTPLQLAAETNNPEIIEMLEQAIEKKHSKK